MSRCRDLSSLTINSGCCHSDTRPVKCRIPGQCSLCIHVGPLTMLACSPPSPPVDLFTQQLGTSAFPYAVVWPLDRAESLFELLTLMTREWPTFPPAHPTPAQDPLPTSRHPPPFPRPLTCTSAHWIGRAAAPLRPAAHRLLNSQPLPAATLRFPVS